MLPRACAQRGRVCVGAPGAAVRLRHRGRPKVLQSQVPPPDPVSAALRAVRMPVRACAWRDGS